jgi:cytochrome c biogenesis protein CcmG/thiol:disulfide interchange protein DsbE
VQPQALVGQPVPNLTLTTLAEGQPANLREAASAGPYLVNFFASWCGPCEIEHPTWMKLKGQTVRVVGVAYKDAPQKTQGFLDRLGDPYAEVLVDRDGRAGVEFGVTGVPETYLVGRDGVIIAKHTGPITEPEARAMAAKAR